MQYSFIVRAAFTSTSKKSRPRTGGMSSSSPQSQWDRPRHRRPCSDCVDEREWVTLRLATIVDGQVDRSGLIAVVADRAKFADATVIVDVLSERGLVIDGRPSPAGRELVSAVLEASEASNGSVWRDLPTDDVDAATRVLNEVLRRARELAASAERHGS